MYLIILLTVMVCVAAAFLAWVRALLALPLFAGFAPYAGVIYALIVLLVIVAIGSWLLGVVPTDRHALFPWHS